MNRIVHRVLLAIERDGTIGTYPRYVMRSGRTCATTAAERELIIMRLKYVRAVRDSGGDNLLLFVILLHPRATFSCHLRPVSLQPAASRFER